MLGTRLAVKSARSCVFHYAQRAQSPPVSSSLFLSRLPRRHASQASSAANPAAQVAGDAASPATLPLTKVSGDGGSVPAPKPAKDLTGGNPRYENIKFTPTTLGFSWKGERYRYPNLWLRDTCRCTQCVNQETMQRNFNITDLPDLSSLAISEVMVETEGIRIVWNIDNHESFYDWALIERHMNKRQGPEPDPSLRQLWGSEIAEKPPTVNYEEVMDSGSDRGMAKLTDHLVRYGLVFVDDTPFDDAVHTKRLLERIGPIRETHYGGFYEFVPDMAKADTAYTNIALAAHTDTTYFTEPAGVSLSPFPFASLAYMDDIRTLLGGRDLPKDFLGLSTP